MASPGRFSSPSPVPGFRGRSVSATILLYRGINAGEVAGAKPLKMSHPSFQQAKHIRIGLQDGHLRGVGSNLVMTTKSTFFETSNRGTIITSSVSRIPDSRIHGRHRPAMHSLPNKDHNP